MFFSKLLSDVGASRSPHEEEGRESMQEDAFNPRRHGMGAGRAMVDIQHTNTSDDGESDQHHGKHQVLPDQRHCERRGGHYL